MAKLLSAESLEDFERILDDSRTHLTVVHFSATWAPQCADMNIAMTELAKDAQYNNVKFVTLEAESVPEVSHKYDVNSVPTFVFIKDKKPIDRLDGANVPELSKKVKRHCGVSGAVSAPQMGQQKASLDDRLKKLVKKSPVMLFMKGTPEEPRCGFSRQIVQLLSDNSVKFDTFNILTDDDVRQGLKKFSNWPTFPQLYANGELLGGLDIVKELADTGELKSQLPEEKSLDDRLKSLINQSEVMLFMKGNASTPRCGFSNTMIGILNQTGVKYDTFDILSDDEVRQGLKKYSNWPTYPQLYVKGDLIGGLDIVKELEASGDLISALEG